MTLLNELNGRTESEDSKQSEIIQPQVQEKNVRQTTFILIGAIAIVFAGVWVMHKKNTPAKATAAVNEQQLQIESAISQLTGMNKENVSQVDEVVKRFYEFADFEQVRPEQLKADPFGLNWAAAIMSAPVGANKSGMTESTANAPKMELLSILKSKYGNCCMIDDMLLYKGDKINGFEVVEIGDDFARLQSAGHTITLYLQTENDK
ncbi:MAG: hypothetical protein WC770_01005 [Phycisphaerae bacterium]|jgi:hypothetical protein